MKWARRQHQTRRQPKSLKTTLFAVLVSVVLVTSILVPLASQTASAAPIPTTSAISTPNVAVVAADTTPSIDPCNATGGNLSWVVCPVINMISGATMGMQAIINRLMMVDVTGTFDKDHQESAKAYYAAWNSFRIFGVALIIIAGLIMVISQALGMEMFDAYTVKKVLPRMLLAIIGISLSWWLMKFLAEFTNDLGVGMRSIIYYPFKGLIANGTGIQSLGSSLIESLIGGAAILFLGIGGILSLLATAALAALVAFLVLIVRQIVITFLILLAPIAIACYVLPNTEKAYKLWWDSLSKGLMMFPIISAFIAAGQVFSVVAGSNTNSNYGISNVVAILAYFLPYFALPFTFRLAGGALATLGGLTNDRSRGAFDALKNKRKAIVSDRVKRAQNQSLWDNNNAIGRRANKVATWVTDPGSNAAYYGRNIPGLRKRGHSIAGMIEHGQVEQSGKLFEELNKMGFNDKAYRLLSGTYEPGKEMTKKLAARGITGAPTSISQLQTAAEVLATGDQNEQLAANAIHASMGRLATLYRDGEMTKASSQAAGILGLAAHGFASSGDLATAANGLQETLGTGAAQSIIGQAQLMGTRSRPETKNGYGVMYDQSLGKFVDGMKGSIDEGGQIESRARAVLKTLNSQDLAGAKGGAFTAMAPTITEVLNEGGGEASAVRDQLIQWAGPYSSASVDVKAQALDYIKNYQGSYRGEKGETLQQELEKSLRQNYVPDRDGPIQTEPPEQPGGGGPR